MTAESGQPLARRGWNLMNEIFPEFQARSETSPTSNSDI